MLRNFVSPLTSVLFLACILMGCPARRPRPGWADVAPPRASDSYIDIQPDWRIKVITPILKSGEFLIDSQYSKSSKVGPDFVGYEVAYYAAQPRPGGGVSMHFSSAELFRDGKGTRTPRPTFPLFKFPPDMAFVRILFLTRVSEADHDQGILAARSLAELDDLTRRVERDPEQNCTTAEVAICSWVPLGIAVRPQE